MPVVTVDPNDYQRFDLKSAPADPDDPTDEQGYVMLRPLPYGMKLTMRDKSIKQRMMLAQPKRGQSQAQREAESTPVELETASEWSTHYEMSYCIGDHNLTDRNKRKIDFTNPMSLKLLNPKVGSEIEKLLFELNRDEDEESLEDFLKRSSISSEGERSMSQVGSSTDPEVTPSPDS